MAVTADPLIGHQFANFRLERVLGRGGMGTVYYGQDVRLLRPVAIKVIDDRYRDDPTYATRFIQEARSVAGWRHENIVQVYYAGDEDGLYYFVMEYIHGVDLGRILRRYAEAGELLQPGEVLRIARAAANALDYAHQHGVIHRDVKPSNLMVAEDGRVVLTDFGLALHLSQGSLGEVFGSPRYIAPEQARNSAHAVPQSDLYSLGVILYEMLVGCTPFDDPSPTAMAIQHITQPPPAPRQFNPALGPAVEAVLLRALSKEAAERFPSGRDLLQALEDGLLADGPADPQAQIWVGPRLSAQPLMTNVTRALALREDIPARPPGATPDRPAGPFLTLPVVGLELPPADAPLARWAIGCWVIVLITLVGLIIEIFYFAANTG